MTGKQHYLLISSPTTVHVVRVCMRLNVFSTTLISHKAADLPSYRDKSPHSACASVAGPQPHEPRAQLGLDIIRLPSDTGHQIPSISGLPKSQSDLQLMHNVVHT
jgi:hypothetical protein